MKTISLQDMHGPGCNCATCDPREYVHTSELRRMECEARNYGAVLAERDMLAAELETMRAVVKQHPVSGPTFLGVPICMHPPHRSRPGGTENGPGIAKLDLRPKQLIADEEWPDELDLLADDVK